MTCATYTAAFGASRNTMRAAFSYLSLVGLLAAIACSSSSSPSPAPSPGTGGDGGSSGGCSCALSYNGASRTISCGTDTCLNGATFTCGKNAEVAQGATCTGPSTGDGGGNSGSFECTWGAPGADSLKTTYSCPDQASYDKCTGGNSTACTPKDKKPGTVPPGGACVKAYVAGKPGDEYELADDCAPVPKWGGFDNKHKGSFCESGPFCTHPCSQVSDCSDVAGATTCDKVCEK